MNKSLTLLGLDPLLLGTSGAFPLHFFATYNLAEVSSYIGIMPVMGLVGLLARRHRRSPEARRWWIWYVIAGLGLLLTWGSFTPLGHVFFHLPLFNRQRLLSRNLLEVDLAVAVLFAAWVDHMFLSPSPVPAVPGARDGGAPSGSGARVVAASCPGPTGGARTSCSPSSPRRRSWSCRSILLAGGPWFPHFLHVPGPVTRSTLWPLVAFLTLPSAISAWAMWLVLRRQRLARVMPCLLTALLLVDLALFNGFIQGAPDPVGATTDQRHRQRLGRPGRRPGPGPAGGLHRVAVFDPDRYYSVQVERLGEPDLNILRGLDSVQGYGAVVDAAYDRATDTHEQLNMNSVGVGRRHLRPARPRGPGHRAGVLRAPRHRRAGLAQQRRVAGVTADPARAALGRGAPLDTTTPPPTPANDYQYAPPPPATVSLVPGHPRTQYLGTVLSVTVGRRSRASGSPGSGASAAGGAALPRRAPHDVDRLGPGRAPHARHRHGLRVRGPPRPAGSSSRRCRGRTRPSAALRSAPPSCAPPARAPTASTARCATSVTPARGASPA